jgi:hypothetical protein
MAAGRVAVGRCAREEGDRGGERSRCARVAVGRGRRTAFVARAPRRAGDLPPNLAQQQRVRLKIPRARFFPAPAGGRYRAARAQKSSYYSAAAGDALRHAART